MSALWDAALKKKREIIVFGPKKHLIRLNKGATIIFEKVAREMCFLPKPTKIILILVGQIIVLESESGSSSSDQHQEIRSYLWLHNVRKSSDGKYCNDEISCTMSIFSLPLFSWCGNLRCEKYDSFKLRRTQFLSVAAFLQNSSYQLFFYAFYSSPQHDKYILLYVFQYTFFS